MMNENQCVYRTHTLESLNGAINDAGKSCSLEFIGAENFHRYVSNISAY